MPKVFISYSRAEAAFAGAVRTGLVEVGIQPWLDVADVPPGYNVQRAIQDGIRTSDILVVLVSPASLASKWVEVELTTAAAFQLSNIGVKVLPVLLAGMSAEDLPSHLQAINCVSGAGGAPDIVRSVLRVVDDQPIRVFLAPDRGKYNVDYYRYLNDRIREATREVWITGNGFNCENNPEGKRRADAMVAAFEDRLRNHVRVYRVQTGAGVDDYWADQMLGLAAHYPTTMELYRFQEEAQHALVSLAAIDPGSASSSVAEIMLSDRRNEDPNGDYANVATFVRRDPATAQVICSRIKDLMQANGAYRVYPTPDAKSHLVGVVHYFAYGSNMNVDQMQHRSRNLAKREEVGRLRGYELTLDQLSDRYVDGAVATITASPQANVPGVIWTVPWATIVSLDKDEGPDLYRRERHVVHGLSGRQYHCHVYIGRVRTEKPASPSYLAKLIDASTDANLPRDHVDALRSKLGTT